MAVFQSTAITKNRPIRGQGDGGARGAFLLATVALTSAAALNDTFEFGYLPPDARVIGGWLKSDDLDSNGSPTITFDIGDAGSTTRFWSASTVPQAGTVSTTMAATGYNATYTSKTKIYGTVHAAAATPVAGNVTLCLFYVCEEPV